MRRLLFIVVAVFAAVAEAESVTLVSPTTISIPVIGDKGQLRVFYTAPASTTAIITGDGPIVAGRNIGFAPSRATTPPSFVIEVRASREILRPGATRTANVIFSAPGNEPVAFPVTITRPAVTFTATPSQTDICLACGEPDVVTVKITNGGQTPIVKLKVGAVEMSDASRKHRWILPCKSASRKPAMRDRDGRTIVFPCGDANVAIEPGDTRTISVAIQPPPFAGDYATTMELSAQESPTVSVSLVVRIRGPWGRWPIPLTLFLSAVVLGGVLAHVLEHFFGSGGGEIRTRALISLHAAHNELVDLRNGWINDAELTNTLRRLAADIDQVDLIIAHADQRTAEDLQAQAVEYGTRLEKRRRLRQKVAFARGTPGKEKRVPDLDLQGDGGTVAEYDERLEAILAAADTEAVKNLADEQDAERAKDEMTRKAAETRLRNRRKIMFALRWITLGLVSVATAYLALYFNKCSYGTVADYITALFWGLGLTQAGNALTAEGRSKFTPPPAESGEAG